MWRLQASQNEDDPSELNTGNMYDANVFCSLTGNKTAVLDASSVSSDDYLTAYYTVSGWTAGNTLNVDLTTDCVDDFMISEGFFINTISFTSEAEDIEVGA